MAFEPPESTRLEELATADPQEVCFRVWVSDKQLRDGGRPARGTAYKDTRLPKTMLTKDGFGDYVLLECEDGPGNLLGFTFGKTRTAAEKRVAVDSWEDYRVVNWPAVLEGLRLVSDRNAPNSVRSASGGVTLIQPMIAQVAMTPETAALCQVRVERFQSHEAFTGLTYPRPVPGLVSWNFGNAGGGSFTALHPDVRIARPGYYQTLADATPGYSDTPFTQDLFFPATRFKQWRPYVLDARPSRKNGMYILDRYTVYPPPKPKIVFRDA